MKFLKAIPIFLTILALNSCGSVMKVSDLNEKGFFYATKESTTLKSVDFDLDSNKQLLVVPNSEYMKGMAEKLNYLTAKKAINEKFKTDVAALKAKTKAAVEAATTAEAKKAVEVEKRFAKQRAAYEKEKLVKKSKTVSKKSVKLPANKIAK